MRSIVKEYSLALYFLLTFAVTWICVLPWIVTTSMPGVVQDLNPVINGIFSVLFIGGLALGPAISAIIVTGIDSGRSGVRELFGRTIKWRVGVQWYLAAVFVPLILYLSAGGLHFLLGGSFSIYPLNRYPFRDYVSQYSAYNPILVAIVVAIVFFLYIWFLGGGLEELGWRGYALPKLQGRYKCNATVSSLIVGVFWGFWHLPLFFIPGAPQYGYFFPAYLMGTVGLAFILTWVYNNTHSIFVVILLHTMENFWFWAFALLPRTAYPMYWLLYLIVQWTFVIILILIFGATKLSRKPELSP
jgi:membrane protease YdiL (CAAX protease family)